MVGPVKGRLNLERRLAVRPANCHYTVARPGSGAWRKPEHAEGRRPRPGFHASRPGRKTRTPLEPARPGSRAAVFLSGGLHAGVHTRSLCVRRAATGTGPRRRDPARRKPPGRRQPPPLPRTLPAFLSVTD